LIPQTKLAKSVCFASESRHKRDRQKESAFDPKRTLEIIDQRALSIDAFNKGTDWKWDDATRDG